jgi:integrase
MLTELAIRAAKPAEKNYKLHDSGGLYLIVATGGGKWWRYDYRLAGKRKTISLGTYPNISLKAARLKRDESRLTLASGVDPSPTTAVNHVDSSMANSFETIAREWYLKFSSSWVDSHGSRILRRLERDIFPWIGMLPIADIKAPDLLACLRRIEDRGAAETTHRALQNCSQVFRYAMATGALDRNPAADLRGALAPVREQHYAAILKPKQLGDLLRSMDGYEGTFVTKCALRLAPILFVRPGELRKAEWSEFDLDAAEWNIPAERMKMRQAHLVPLATQAVKILTELKALTGRGRYVFPSARSDSRPMSDNAVLSALRRMGYSKDEMTGHGFRAVARTILDEVLGVRPDFIEHQLAHAVRDPNGRAYNRTAHLAERRKMMQQWADYLDQLREGKEMPT